MILTENPLEAIRNSLAIRYVMKHGVLYRGEDASRIHPDPRATERFYFKVPN